MALYNKIDPAGYSPAKIAGIVGVKVSSVRNLINSFKRKEWNF